MPNEFMSIDQLKNDTPPKSVTFGGKPVNLSRESVISVDDLAKDMPEPEHEPTYLDKEFVKLDEAVERYKQEMTEFRIKVEEEEFLAEQDSDEDAPMKDMDDLIDFLDDELDSMGVQQEYIKPKVKLEVEPMEEVKPEVVQEEPVKEAPKTMKKKEVVTEPTNFDTTTVVDEEDEKMFLDDDDLDDDEDLSKVTAESERKERAAHVRSVVRTAYDEFLDKVDLSRFTINKKPVSVSNALATKATKQHAADWVLYDSGICISISQLTGPDIEKMDIRGSNRGAYNAYLDMFRVIYNHTLNPNKGTLEQWLKTISFYDMNDLMFAVYRACFGHNNHILYTCEKDKETFMEQKPIEEMVKFKDEKVKARCKSIMDKGINTTEPEYHAKLVQISDNYAAAIRVPSIYDTILAPLLLPDEWREKYSDLISTCAFVDALYVIDRQTNSLTPISTNPVVNNDVKTMKNKIRTFNKVFTQLDSREYAKLKGQIDSIGGTGDAITYQIPAAVCPKCNTEIPAQDMDPLQMLFTYHQLGQAAYTYEN